jgi:Animal haem peroxidase
MKEHNAICERLKWAYPHWSEDELFHRARLINSALMAKIQTVDFTEALLDHPTTRWGARINWWGVAGKRVKQWLGRLSSNEVLSGIPGGPTDDHGVPFAITEEFVSIYRLHPLIPDEYTFWSLEDGEKITTLNFSDIDARRARQSLQKLKAGNCLYSFGISHPGVIGLHNYPECLRRFVRPINEEDIADGQVEIVDLGAIDILRDRERRVPRYNEFRRQFGLPPAKTFRDLTDDRQLAKEIEEAYYGDIEQVDLMIGLYAERKPEGFAISDTAFRVFILMASRRLEADRFLSSDYSKEVYTPEGIRWVEKNNLASVLRRHHPQLEPALRGVPNAFKRWNLVGTGPVLK